MPFPDAVLVNVRRRAHFQCCLCKSLGVEVHHIVPQSDGGPDSDENAAPLCPSCHETYGANPTKRRFIREARDLWYEICAKRYASDYSLLSDVHALASIAASKTDVAQLRDELLSTLRSGASTPHVITIGSAVVSPTGRIVRTLSINDHMALLFSRRTARPEIQAKIPCLKEFWPVSGGLRREYKSFVSRFGVAAMELLTLRVLDDLKIPMGERLTEDDIVQAVHGLHVEVILLSLQSEGEIHSGLTQESVIWWWRPERDAERPRT